MGRQLLFLLILINNISLVSAYIDPGTGGMIISSSGGIIGLIIAMIIGFFSKHIFKPFKKLWSKIRRK